MKAGRTRLAWAFVLGIAAFLLYSPSLKSGFVYDAEVQIEHDSYIHTPSHLADVVSLRVLGQDVLDGTRPAHLFFLMTDSLVWGRDPFGYHLTSNLLHALNVALLFLLLARLGNQCAPAQSPLRVTVASALGAALFAIHPALTEAVSEVSDREDPLATFFILVALAIAGKFPCRTAVRTALCGAACTGSLVLAAASKETGFMGPLLLALYAWLFHRAIPRKAWIALISIAFVAVGAFAAARFGMEPAASKIFAQKPHYIGGSLAAVFTIQPRIWTFLIWNTAWPLNLSADYTPRNLAWITPLIAAGVLAAFLAAQLLLAIKSRLALFGAAIFWLGLAPVSNFIPLYRPIGDRFLYLPMAGLAATLCAALLLVRGRILFPALSACSFAAVLSLAPLNLRRQTAFANPLNLWRDATAKSPSSITAADNLGFALSNAGDYQGALDSFVLALQMDGTYADAWAGAAITLDRMGRHADADAAFQKAVSSDPRYARPQELLESLGTDPSTAATLEKILVRQSRRIPAP